MSKMKKIMSFFSLFFCAALSSVILSLGIPNEIFLSGSALLGIFSLAPLYVSLRESRSFKEAGILCGTHIGVVHLLSSFWLANFKDFAVFTLGASTAAYFGLGVLMGWCFFTVLHSKAVIRPFSFAACWVCWEWLKSTGFLAYPWGTVPMTSLSLHLFIQIVDITGIWGISFMFAAVSAFSAEFLYPDKKNTKKLRPLESSGNTGWKEQIPGMVFLVCLFFSCCVYGIYALSRIPLSETSFTASVIQQNSDPWGEGGNISKSLKDIQDLTREAVSAMEESTGRKPHIVLWSESSLPYPYNIHKEYYNFFPRGDDFISFMKEIDVPLFTGTPYITVNNGRERAYNAVALINPDGNLENWYAKMQLVPFAEYIPFTEYKIVSKFFDSLIGFSSGWEPGSKKTVFNIKVMNENGESEEIPFTAPICFEDAFPGVTSRLHNEGGQVLINLTNDSWSKTASAEYQHFAAAYFRAVELRTTLIRSTNGGFTAVVSPAGEILCSLPIFERAFLNAEIPVYPHFQTFYAVFGDWAALLSAVCAILSATVVLKNEKKSNYRRRSL